MPRKIAISALFLLLFPLASIAASFGAARHTLDITIDIPGRSITGTDRIAVEKGSSVMTLILRSGSEVTRIENGSKDIPFKATPAKDFTEIAVKLPEGEDLRDITVHFRGRFQSPAEAQEHVKRGVAYLEDGVIGEEGVFLPSSALWYPATKGFSVFEARVTMPRGYASVMEGENTGRTEAGTTVTEKWTEWKPLDGIDLVAGRYDVKKEMHGNVAVYTYFFKDDAALSKTYIDKTKEYLDIYKGLIGPYPFAKFAVVENFMPTGYGMPSFTLLGSTVLRLPFIPDTSLGHEVAHNWWGNSVFVDSSLGNWSEAITTFTSDYLYERRKGEKEARDFRLAKLRGYKAYAEDSATTLRGFRDATGTESRSVGYNKGVMVFNMLERHIGEAAFRDGLKRFYSENAFKRASWADIQDSFEAASGKDLGWFFEQWLGRPGGPSLKLLEAGLDQSGKKHIVRFRVEQASPAYAFDLPVLFETATGPVWKTFNIKTEDAELTAELDVKPISMELDPLYQNFRILSDREAPATFAGFFGDPGATIVLPQRNDLQDKYTLAADQLKKDFGLELTTDAEIGRKDFLKDRSVFILGGPKENRLYWLTGQYFSRHAKITEDAFEIDGRVFPRKGSVLAMAAKNPHDPSKTLCLLATDLDRQAVLEAARRLRYFTDSSWLLITPDGKAEKGTFDGEKALKTTFK